MVESIEIDGELLNFEDGEILSGKTLDEAIDNGAYGDKHRRLLSPLSNISFKADGFAAA